MNQDRLLDALRNDEGLRLKPYKDTVGKLTIGVGRNLDDVGITEGEAHLMLQHDVERTVADLTRLIPWWTGLNDARQEVICNMAFNMGSFELYAHWPNWLLQLRTSQFDLAAANMLATLWARQVGPRAMRLAEQMRTGACAP